METAFPLTSRGGFKLCLGGHIYRYQKCLAGGLSLGGNATDQIAISDAPDSQLLEEGARLRRCKPRPPWYVLLARGFEEGRIGDPPRCNSNGRRHIRRNANPRSG